jgi:cyclophilin family peptidyl-prolyl cis-trans isomerase
MPRRNSRRLEVKHLITAALVLMAIACAPKSENTGTQTESTTTQSSSTTATTQTETTATTATTTTTETTASAPVVAKPAEQEKKPMSEQAKIAELHTSKGEIDIRFFPDVAPNHVKNFLDLAQKGFYNGTKFHRVIPGFMIQGGDPNTVSGDPGSWGMGGSPNKLQQEFNKIHHARGIVSMARSQDVNSASSQFFIVVADSGFLDNQYTVFGQVTKGMDVADTIVNAPKDARNDRPNEPVSIDKIVIRDAKTPEEKAPTPK